MGAKYQIEDWAGNILNYDGRFKRPELAVPKRFATFEDGWAYVDATPALNECRDDLYVVEVEPR